MNSPGKSQRGPVEARQVSLGSIQLRVLDVGSGMPVLLVHGFPLDHTMWDAQTSTLRDRYRVIAPDLRGFGGSSMPDSAEETTTVEQMADDLAALLDALQIVQPIALCGLSMGGYVAFQFWRKYPQRLRALVLCDTRAVADTPEGAASRMKMVEHVLRAGTQYVAEAMLPKLFAQSTFAEQADVVDFERQKILSASPWGIAAALRGLAIRPDVRELLPSIQLPTLVIVGEHDAISSPEEMRGIAEQIPAAEFVTIPRSGHMTPLENSPAFNAALSAFLGRVTRGTPS